MHKVIHNKMLITLVQGGTRAAANFVPLCTRIKIKKIQVGLRMSYPPW